MDKDKRKLTEKELKRKDCFEKFNSEMQHKGYNNEENNYQYTTSKVFMSFNYVAIYGFSILDILSCEWF